MHKVHRNHITRRGFPILAMAALVVGSGVASVSAIGTDHGTGIRRTTTPVLVAESRAASSSPVVAGALASPVTSAPTALPTTTRPPATGPIVVPTTFVTSAPTALPTTTRPPATGPIVVPTTPPSVATAPSPAQYATPGPQPAPAPDQVQTTDDPQCVVTFTTLDQPVGYPATYGGTCPEVESIAAQTDSSVTTASYPVTTGAASPERNSMSMGTGA
jgi:hypothetical protein